MTLKGLIALLTDFGTKKDTVICNIDCNDCKLNEKIKVNGETYTPCDLLCIIRENLKN